MLTGTRRAIRLLSLTEKRFIDLEKLIERQPEVASSFLLHPFQFLEESMLMNMSSGTETHIVITSERELLGSFAFTYFTHPGIADFFRKHIRLDVALPVTLERTSEKTFRLTIQKVEHVRNASGLTIELAFEADETNDKDHRAKLEDETFLARAVSGIYRRMRDPNVKTFLNEERWSIFDGCLFAFELASGLCMHASYDRDFGFIVIDPRRFKVVNKELPIRGSIEEGWLQIKLPRPHAMSRGWVDRLSDFQPERNELSAALQTVIAPVESEEPVEITRSSAFTWERFVTL